MLSYTKSNNYIPTLLLEITFVPDMLQQFILLAIDLYRP